jgi:hypothetical protein
MKNIWKILPVFVVEYWASRNCERLFISGVGKVVQPFKGFLITVKK